MALKRYKPTTSSIRHLTLVDKVIYGKEALKRVYQLVWQEKADVTIKAD